ncbi:MAG TPA: hypothetical protein ENF16_06685 [Bacteroidetes bacterium]|nr:hypothetical protein [Bacteroidota bacterium]
MNRRSIPIFIALGLIIPLLAWSQSDDTSVSSKFSEYLRSGTNTGLGIQSFGLLDPSRMTFSTSYSMSYFSSGGEGVMRNLFMETIGYRLSDPVSLTFNLGYLHQPYSSYGPDGVFQEGSFVGGAALTWRPAKNMFLRLEVANYGAPYGYNYYPYGMMGPPYSPIIPSPQPIPESSQSGE